MAGFLDTLIGNPGQYGQAATNVWQNGQFMPYNLNLPGANFNFSGTNASGSLSGQNQNLNTAFGNQIQNNLGVGYNPNTSFLPNAYANMYSNFNDNVNSQFQNMASAQMPFLQQATMSNLDNEFSKGTLASTAGSYQTAGQNMATNAAMANMYNQAYQNTLQKTGQQFNAANATAQLGEQQAQFAPTFAQNQTQGLFQNMLGQNQQILSGLGLGGQLGAQRSQANINATLPQLGVGQYTNQQQSGLINSLLFGNGQGGLLGQVLNGYLGGSGGGSSGQGGGLLGSIGGGIGNLLSGLNYNGTWNTGNYSNDLSQSSDQAVNDMFSGAGSLNNFDYGSLGFNPAGGEATASNTQGFNNAAFDAYQSGNEPQMSSVSGPTSGIGEEALNANLGQPSAPTNYLGAGGNALGIAQGLQQGGLGGYLGAASNANRLLNNVGIGGSSTLNTGLGAAGNALGIYNGLKQGGVSGYGQAAGSAAQLAGTTMGNSALSAAGGYVAAPLAVANFADNWQSGKTGSDALNGASAGAAIGSVIPGVGTAVGALVGGAIGALSSAFGGGAKDPEQDSWGGYFQAYNNAAKSGQGQSLANSVSNPYLPLAGLFDLRGKDITGNIPMYDQYGRMGEQKFVTDMTSQINQGLQSGAISKNSSPQQVMDKVVQPWIDSFGKGQNTDPNKDAMTGLLTDMVGQYMNGSYRNQWKAVGGDAPFSNLPAFGSSVSSSPGNLDSASGGGGRGFLNRAMM